MIVSFNVLLNINISALLFSLSIYKSQTVKGIVHQCCFIEANLFLASLLIDCVIFAYRFWYLLNYSTPVFCCFFFCLFVVFLNAAPFLLKDYMFSSRMR